MIIEKETTVTINDRDYIKTYYEFTEYLDEAAVQELITQLKAYVDQELGGNP